MEKGSDIIADESNSESIDSKQKQSQPQSCFYQFEWFPITTSPWIASLPFMFKLVFIVHCMDFYAENIRAFFPKSTHLRLVSQFISEDLQSIAFVFNFLLSFLSMLSLFFNKNQAEGYKYILGWVGSKIFPVLRYLIDINLSISAFFMNKSPAVAPFFAIAAAINLFVNFFGQNYTLRKDYLCCKSMEFMMLMNTVFILGYALNCVGFYFAPNSKIIFLAFLFIQFLLASGLLICFFVFGYVIYRHTAPQIMIVVVINMYCSISLSNFYATASGFIKNSLQSNENLILSACTFIFLNLVSFSLWSSIKRFGSNENQGNLHKKIFFIFNKFQNSSQNINDDCEIRGIIRNHLNNVCANPDCFTNRLDPCYYDSKKNKYCYSNKLNQGKTSFVKFIIKCLYEQQLQLIGRSNTNLLLDYIEFYYMKLKNLFRVSILLIELEKKFLTPFQKLRLTRIKRVMLEQNRKINHELYNGNLDFQNLIYSENKFDEIRIQLMEVLQRNLSFWKYIQNDTINLSAMARILKPNFTLIDKINNNWKLIAKYFQIQKIWKFYYACYTLYIKNEKLKPQFLECFGQSVHEDELFVLENHHIDKTSESEKLYFPSLIFEQDVCCVYIDNNKNKPVIKTVSRYYERMFGYQSHQVIESSLDLMMTPCFQKFHANKFLKWAGQGKSNNENTYEIKKVFPIDKYGYIIPSFKFYKQFLCLNKQLQYVAMFKRNREEESIIILNNNYQIQGMTISVTKSLELSDQDYKSIQGLNILIFMPALIEYTKFDEEKELGEDQLLLNNNNTNHQLTTTFNFGNDITDKSKSKKTAISTKKQFTKNNMIMKLPSEIHYVKEEYQASMKNNSHKEEGKRIYRSICNARRAVEENKNKKSYKIELEIKQIRIDDDNHYIEFYLREVENTDKKNEKIGGESSYRKDNVMEEFEDDVNEEQLNRFFDNSQSSQNISLAFSDNIFIKEENNQPVKMIGHVKSISAYVRIIFVLFFGLLIGSLLFEYRNYDLYEENCRKLKDMTFFHLKTLVIDNHYHSQAIRINAAKQTVQKLTEDLKTLRGGIQFKKAILDQSINEPRLYQLYKGDKNSHKFDQIDLVDKIYENIIRLFYIENGNVNSTSIIFTSFQQTVIPAFQSLTSTAQLNIDKKFHEINHLIQIKNNIYLGVGILILIAGFILVVFSLIKISKSLVSLMEIFTHFNESDLKKIIKYCLNISQMFAHISHKYDQFKEKDYKNSTEKSLLIKTREEKQKQQRERQRQSSTFQGLGHMQVEPTLDAKGGGELDNANLNKKIKKVENGKQLTNLKQKSVIFVIIFLLIYGSASFGLNFYISVVNNAVIEFEELGYEVFKFYSTINICLLSYKDRAIHQSQFASSRYTKYQQSLELMKKLKEAGEVGMSGRFTALRNNILFSNVCEEYSSILKEAKYTVEECKNMAENNLQHGVQSFLFYLSSNVYLYLNSQSYVINRELLMNLEKGLEVSNILFEYLLQEWMKEFIAAISNLKRNIIIICSCLIVFQIVIYIVLIEILIVGNLKSNFIFFKKIYDGLMPDFIVTKEKIIKAKLEVQGIVKK